MKNRLSRQRLMRLVVDLGFSENQRLWDWFRFFIFLFLFGLRRIKPPLGRARKPNLRT